LKLNSFAIEYVCEVNNQFTRELYVERMKKFTHNTYSKKPKNSQVVLMDSETSQDEPNNPASTSENELNESTVTGTEFNEADCKVR
jgi:hypothetical protein